MFKDVWVLTFAAVAAAAVQRSRIPRFQRREPHGAQSHERLQAGNGMAFLFTGEHVYEKDNASAEVLRSTKSTHSESSMPANEDRMTELDSHYTIDKGQLDFVLASILNTRWIYLLAAIFVFACLQSLACAAFFAKTSGLESGAKQKWIEKPRLLDGSPLNEQLQWYPPPLRTHTRRELMADRTVNFTTVSLGIVLAILLLRHSILGGDSGVKIFRQLVYSICMVTMLTASAIYHELTWNWYYERILKSIDFMGVSFMIAGTYLPLLGAFELYSIVVFVWFLAVAGTVMDVCMVATGNKEVTQWYRRVLLGRFLLMGWSFIPALPHISGHPGFPLAIAGGLAYTAGLLVFLSKCEFNQAVWHLCVFVGTVLVFSADYMYIAGTGPGPVFS